MSKLSISCRFLKVLLKTTMNFNGKREILKKNKSISFLLAGVVY